jgi:hypothetical protein
VTGAAARSFTWDEALALGDGALFRDGDIVGGSASGGRVGSTGLSKRELRDEEAQESEGEEEGFNKSHVKIIAFIC